MPPAPPQSAVPVLYVDNSFTFGGAINALADLLSAIDRDRIVPLVLSAQDPGFLESKFRPGDARHWQMSLPWVDRRDPSLGSEFLRRSWGRARALWWMVSGGLPEAMRIARFARANGVRILHLNNGVLSMLPSLAAAKMLGIPVVAHARGPQRTTGAPRFYASLVDQWIAVSEFIADNLRESGVPPERITVIHDALDLSAFTPGEPPASLRAELDIPAGTPVFGVFGRVIPWKGILEFVRAAIQVLARVPEARALIVGDRSDGSADYYDEVVTLARQSGYGERILFTGFRPDVPALMRLCDVVLHTSTEPEPFGLTVVEAMASGRPIVAANSGGPLETVVPGVTGELVDPTDTAALADAITRFLTDRELTARVGRAAAEHAHRAFSPAVHAERVERVYARLPHTPLPLIERRPASASARVSA